MDDIAEQLMPEEHQGTVEASGEMKVESEGSDLGCHDPSQEKGEDLPPMGPASMSNLEVSLERLLQRQRSEVMFELRRLQYGERPVTGQEQRRRAVENLVLRAVRPVAARSASVHPQESITDRFSDAPSVDVSRPEHILVEVNALVERRPVSSILNSLQFRRRLENSVRDALQTMTAGLDQRSTRATSTAPSNTNHPNASAEAEADTQRSASNGTSSPSVNSLRSESPQSSASVAVAVETGSDAVDRPAVSVQTPGNDVGTARAEEWIQQHMALPNDSANERQRRAVDLLQRMHNEEFVFDISDLIHRQLVTSALNGNFRDVLERRMRRHMETSGINGARVQEQLRHLPRSTVHLRNDFYDLGILPGPDAAAGIGDAGDAMDNMSVISATAAVAIPHAYTQSNAAMSREIHSLRTELQEMKNMMRLSFDLQLDIQRSIRQEVSAALSQTLGGRSEPIASTTSGTFRHSSRAAASDGRCLICLDHEVDTVLYQCGHLCLCHACAMQMRQNGSNCPVCRAPIRDIMRTYRP